MKKWLIWCLLGVLAYLCLLVAYLPAAQVIALVTLPKHVKVQGVSGTLWQGKAQVIQYQGINLEQVKWQTAFLPLLWAETHVHLEAGNSRESQSLSVDTQLQLSLVDTKAFEAYQLQAYVPANILASRLPLPMPVQAGGRVKVDIQELVYAQGCQQLDGQVNWLNAQVNLPQQAVDLGQFKADVKCQNQGLLLTIQEPNKLGLDITATLSPQGPFSAQGRFKLDDDLPAAFHQGAAIFGRPDNQGYRQIKF